MSVPERHSVADKALCHGGAFAYGGCRHCRHVAFDLDKMRLVLQQGPMTEILNCLSGLWHPVTIAAAFSKLVGANIEVNYAADIRVIEFLRKHWDRVVALEKTVIRTSPAVAAAVLAFPSLASTLPQDVPNGAGFGAWSISAANWISKARPNLSDEVRTDGLEPEDIFLAACYWDELEAVEKLASRKGRTDWTWEEVQKCLSERSHTAIDGENSRLANRFAVFALQPRMAELAFPKIYQYFEGMGKAELVDLNRAALAGQHRWNLVSKPQLPTDDWEIRNRDLRVDVKCNLFFRSHASKEGLRGFCIDLKKESLNGCIAGFVFFESDSKSAKCSFVGLLRPGDVHSVPRDNRIAPFWFRMPDSCRFGVVPNDTDAATAVSLVALVDQVMQGRMRTSSSHPRWPAVLAWADKIKRSEIERFPPDSRLPIAFVADVFRKSKPETPPLERILWQAATDAVVELRSKGTPKSEVDHLLKVFEQIYASPWLPVHLAKVGSRALLEIWNKEVLHELNANWDDIACPACGSKEVTVEPETLSESGTLNGYLRCNRCHLDRRVTLITHCWRCGHYPLVIGKNKLCLQCNGLKCDWMLRPPNVCGACKEGAVDRLI
jgi:hypothetical protein